MIADGHLCDGSWNLNVYVTNLQVNRVLRVKGDLHIGGVMLKLVDDLDIAIDWSEHALWWPHKNEWLTRTRNTLDQCGVQADAVLHFTPMKKTLRIQLPDLRYLDARVDFSVNTFTAVGQICKELGIRHPEEVSFCKPLEPHHLKHNLGDLLSKEGKRKQDKSNGHGHIPADTNTFVASHSPSGSTGSLDRTGNGQPFLCAPVTPTRTSTPQPQAQPPRNTSTPVNSTSNGSWPRNANTDLYNTNVSFSDLDALNGSLESSLATSPETPNKQVRARLIRPKSLEERARMNVGWLDSSLSIMEQGVREFDTLCLRFKFYSFYDLNPVTDAVRINQIYEQAKWQLLNEEIDCTEEEALMFGALQIQVNIQSRLPQQPPENNCAPEDDIDAALLDLQVSLEGTQISSGDITSVPELYDYLRFLKPKRFTLRAFKRYWFMCRDLQLNLFKSREEAASGIPPSLTINLRGCEVTPDVNLPQRKYGIKLEVPSAEGMAEMWIRCDTEDQYAKWMAACRLAAKGRSLADSSYEAEVRSISEFLQLQRPAAAPAISADSLNINPEDYAPPRFARKLRGKLLHRLLEAHANVTNVPLIDAKLNYIRAWQSLPEHGVSLFIIRMQGSKKDEILGVASNRLLRMDLHSGLHLQTWRYSSVKAWNVNWEVKHMMVQFEGDNIVFKCLSADCKVIHEFIGGYIFLSMRSKEANQTLNEELFHKLTGGWV